MISTISLVVRGDLLEAAEANLPAMAQYVSVAKERFTGVKR